MKKHIKENLELVVTKAETIQSLTQSLDSEEVRTELSAVQNDIVEITHEVLKSLAGSKHTDDKFLGILDTSTGPEVITQDDGTPHLFLTQKELREHAKSKGGGAPVRVFRWKAY